MMHRKHRFKLGRTSSHRQALCVNLAKAVINSGKISTTVKKAKACREFLEKLITTAKEDSLAAVRKINATLRIRRNRTNAGVVEKSIDNSIISKLKEFASKNKDRPGGYTRIIRTANRKGDAAEMCVFEIIKEYTPVKKSESSIIKAK